MSLRELLRSPFSTLRLWWDAHRRLWGVLLPWLTGVLFAIYAIWRFIKAFSLS